MIEDTLKGDFGRYFCVWELCVDLVTSIIKMERKICLIDIQMKE